jgi:diguanylate cyclase (GGDEF)-like protein
MTTLDDPTIQSLASRFFERRKIELYTDVRHQRAALAEKMVSSGITSGAFNVEVTGAFVSGFETFARGLVADTLGLVAQSVGELDAEAARWVKEWLEPRFEKEVEHLCGEVAGSPELHKAVDVALKRSLASVERDLGIELDLSLLKSRQAAAVVDEALLDALVRLQNRRGLEKAFRDLTAASNTPFCLAMFDIDLFKQVNDGQGLGHDVGDEALVAVATSVDACVRGKGTVFRYGGDEFVILLPNHTLQEGLAVTERARRQINEAPLTSRQLALTISIGVALWPDDGGDLEALMKAADTALYDAKNRGRNLVRYCGEPEPPAPGPREPDRKEPDPGGLSAEQQRKIRQDYFQNGAARCPRDRARLVIHNVSGYGEARGHLIVVCPDCGLNADVP